MCLQSNSLAAPFKYVNLFVHHIDVGNRHIRTGISEENRSRKLRANEVPSRAAQFRIQYFKREVGYLA
jgi:hypothetical protein